MKKIISSFVFICFAIFCCKKNPFDYRSKYFGEYNCTVHETHWLMYTGTTKDTTYSRVIEVKKGGDNNSVEIDGMQTDLEKDGSFSTSYTATNSLKGKFETKKKLNYTYCGGGKGTQACYAVTGERK